MTEGDMQDPISLAVKANGESREHEITSIVRKSHDIPSLSNRGQDRGHIKEKQPDVVMGRIEIEEEKNDVPFGQDISGIRAHTLYKLADETPLVTSKEVTQTDVRMIETSDMLTRTTSGRTDKISGNNAVSAVNDSVNENRLGVSLGEATTNGDGLILAQVAAEQDRKSTVAKIQLREANSDSIFEAARITDNRLSVRNSRRVQFLEALSIRPTSAEHSNAAALPEPALRRRGRSVGANLRRSVGALRRSVHRRSIGGLPTNTSDQRSTRATDLETSPRPLSLVLTARSPATNEHIHKVDNLAVLDALLAKDEELLQGLLDKKDKLDFVLVNPETVLPGEPLSGDTILTFAVRTQHPGNVERIIKASGTHFY